VQTRLTTRASHRRSEVGNAAGERVDAPRRSGLQRGDVRVLGDGRRDLADPRVSAVARGEDEPGGLDVASTSCAVVDGLTQRMLTATLRALVSRAGANADTVQTARAAFDRRSQEPPRVLAGD
jgi:hypothetical protein